MSSDRTPTLETIILELAKSHKSAIPQEMLEQIVRKFTATQFDDDREATLRFMREIAEEFVLLPNDAGAEAST